MHAAVSADSGRLSASFTVVRLKYFLFFLSSELTMKMIVAVPIALLTFGTFGCSQHASTAPAVIRPAAASSETNTFGESKDEAAGSAATARAANYGTEPAPAADATPPPAAPADATPPK
jgi:hypothetical protein